MLKKSFPTLLAAVIAFLAGCTSTSAAFVKHSPDMSVVRGKILHVENLGSHEFKRLADGIAFTVGEEGCTVKIRLSKKNEQVYHVEKGAVVVFGKSTDYIMRDATSYMRAQDTGSSSF